MFAHNLQSFIDIADDQSNAGLFDTGKREILDFARKDLQIDNLELEVVCGDVFIRQPFTGKEWIVSDDNIDTDDTLMLFECMGD